MEDYSLSEELLRGVSDRGHVAEDKAKCLPSADIDFYKAENERTQCCKTI